MWTEIAYVGRHGEDGHMDYATYRRRGLPMGSGAIESAIRRVINLRLKGNSIFWEEENAEGMLQIRGLVLSGRWDETFANITASIGQRPSAGVALAVTGHDRGIEDASCGADSNATTSNAIKLLAMQLLNHLMGTDPWAS